MTRSPGPSRIYISPGTRGQTSGDNQRYLFGRTAYPPGGRYGPRIQSVFQLVVLLQGSLRVTVDNAVHDLAPGEAILQHPGPRELYHFSPDAESIHTWCHVAPEFLSLADRRLFRRVRGVHPASSAIHLLIGEGLAARHPRSSELHDAMAALARACLLRFAADTCIPEHSDNVPPPHPALQRARDLAAAHYAEIRSAQDLARRVGISASRLRTLCHEARSESPSAMIWRLKVEHAIQLIRSTGLTLGEIAEDCGYANPFHLSRSVHRHTGHSPRQLRQIEWKR